jgi:DNA-binding winged helix-turn-helix (wHTH) protein/TolB-like protein/Flp pilus assembly protein TadD
MPIDIPASPGTALRIGDWLADPATNELRRDGETIRLEPKAMEVLVFLADRAGQVVSREALLTALWAGMVVGDDALTQAVIKLRRSLQDEARAPQYIETIAKRGYRLIAPVKRGAAQEPVVSEAPPAPVPAAVGRTYRLPAARMAVLLAVLLAGATWIYLSQRTESVDPASYPGEEFLQRWAALPTITVTPFETIAGHEAETYLARGIAADLTTDLSRLSGLRVIASTSPAPPGKPGRDGVPKDGPRYLLSGAVQRADGSLRINVRLVDAESGRQLWADRYDRPFKDLLAIQEEIIDHLLRILPVQVSEAERLRLAQRYTRNLVAYDYFLRGRAAFLVRQGEENAVAREMYRKAIELDPGFARAYSGLALTHADDYRNHWTTDGKRSLETASQLAETALQIDPSLADVHSVLGYVRAVQHEFQHALELHERAVRMDPSYADGYAYIGATYTHMGQPAKTIPFMRTAMRLTPGGNFLYFMVLGRAYFFTGDLDQASINLREALARNAGDLETRVFMAATFVAAGDLRAAEWEAEEIRALRPGFTARHWLETGLIADERQKRRVSDLLAKVGL